MQCSTSRLRLVRWLPALLVFGGLCGGKAHAGELVAASGISGAGTRSEGNGRAWAELGLSAWDEEAAAWTQLGLGVALGRSFEVEAQLPIAYRLVEREYTILLAGASEGSGGPAVWLGNPYFGVNLLALGDASVRWRAGAGFTLPVTGLEDFPSELELLPLRAAGGQDPWLWLPGGVSAVGRGRYEADVGQVTLAVDLAASLMFGVSDPSAYPPERTAVLFLQPALELAGFVQPDTLVGARLPMVWGSLDEEYRLSLVPFLRQGLGDFFVEALLTINVVGPDGLGPPGDGPLWGFQLGLGALF